MEDAMTMTTTRRPAAAHRLGYGFGIVAGIGLAALIRIVQVFL
jgi:hypothetical protein